MSLEGQGTLYEHTKGKVVLYLPVEVWRDSAFPFDVGEHVDIRIDADNERLIVEKVGQEPD